MLVIDVPAPSRTEDRYEFRCRIRMRRTPVQRLLRRRPPRQRLRRHSVPGTVRFGFTTTGPAIDHHPIWDSFYPLFYLTRNGGPLFDTGHREATIRFEYPVSATVRDFFVHRAREMGTELSVTAATTHATFDDRGSDRHVLAFGGGKDSRMLLGALRELGLDPLIVTTGAENVPDLPEASVTKAVDGVLADRLMPALMLRGRHMYVGGGLGEAHRQDPWQQYYDVCSPVPMAAMSRMLASVGLGTQLHVPTALLPYNVTQDILFQRYPELYRHQLSVPDGKHSEKNLHVSLCRYHHAIALEPQCTDELFVALLGEFLARQTEQPQPFGTRGHREGFHREMRAIIHRHRDEQLFATVRDRVPDHWAGDWIDYIHTYVDPEPYPPGFLDICSHYARPIEEAPADARLWRIRP